MPCIEVAYCQRSNSLVRLSGIELHVLPNDMVEVIGDCPLHQGERLRVVRYLSRPFSSATINSSPEPDEMLTLERSEAFDLTKEERDIAREIHEHELVLENLISRFEIEDNEAAQPFIFDMPLLARIVGDDRYLELLAKERELYLAHWLPRVP